MSAIYRRDSCCEYAFVGYGLLLLILFLKCICYETLALLAGAKVNF